jgi:FkbM family methyltransferase
MKTYQDGELMNYFKYEEELVENTVGRKFWIYKNDSFYQQRIAGAGPYQGANLKRLRDLCPNARTVIDVGMNIGMNTIEYATWAKKVIGFEPTPQTYDMAIKNIDYAKTQTRENFMKGWYKLSSGWAPMVVSGDIETHHVGLGPEAKDTEIVIRPDNAGHNHIVNDDRLRWTGKTWIERTEKHKKAEYEQVPIRIETLDSYKFEDVDIIKIDVEGFEYDVLLGSKDTVDRCRPVVQVEMVYGQPHRFGHTVHEILEYFESLDYVMTLADGSILPMEWVQKRQGRDMPVKGKMDRFFVPREHESWNNIPEDPFKKLFEEV